MVYAYLVEAEQKRRTQALDCSQLVSPAKAPPAGLAKLSSQQVSVTVTVGPLLSA